jgi:hypothetical protein
MDYIEMKAAQKFALAVGITYVVMGVMGSIPALLTQSDTLDSAVRQLDATAGFGYLMGLFPVNTAHNILHIVTGLVGIAAAISLDSSRFFSGQVGIYYSALAILGLIPVANTFFGLFPLYGLDVLLHGVTGLLGIYFGFVSTPSLLALFKQELRDDATAGEIL